MADYDNQVLRDRGASADQAVDAGLRTYMVRVYNYMMIGLGVTGLAAYFVSATPALYNAIFGTPLIYVAIFAPLALVFALSFGINRISEGTAKLHLHHVYKKLNVDGRMGLMQYLQRGGLD